MNEFKLKPKDRYESKLEQRAAVFATHYHRNQRRKYTLEPYIVHPEEVAAIVKSVPHTEAQVAAAWLHDVVEDCGVELDTLDKTFGREVGTLVYWLSDRSRKEDGNRAKRKAIDREHIHQAGPEAKTVKLADLISNSRTILDYDPDFARVYLAEKAALLEVLTDGDPELFKQAKAIVDNAKAEGRF